MTMGKSPLFAPSIAFGFVFFLSGCATTKLYPICFYEDKPSLSVLNSLYLSNIKNSFISITQTELAEVTVSADVRWIIAKTDAVQDSRALAMWPRVGCIGPAGSTSQVDAQASCINYLVDFMREKKYSELGQYKGISGNTYSNESRDAKYLVYCAKAP